ncbi:MAG: hypothetical protein KF774_17730 [Planctomyces sp.]|nr:hypothetical protein [Planctomyces sp.]
MQLTPEQKAQIAREKAANPDRRSFTIESTPEQSEFLRRARDAEEADKEATRVRVLRHKSLLAEGTFGGSLRRAIKADGRTWAEHEQASGVPAGRVESFYFGDLELTLDETNRLVASLGLQLVPVGA